MTKKPLHQRLAATAPIDDVAQAVVDETNAGNDAARYWLEPMARFGMTPQLAAEIERELANAEMPLRVVAGTAATKKGVKTRLFLTYTFDGLTERQLFAVNVARLDEKDWLGHIKQCPKCRTFFVGDLRARWCSTSCGSVHRVYAKRDRDRKEKAKQKRSAKQ